MASFGSVVLRWSCVLAFTAGAVRASGQLPSIDEMAAAIAAYRGNWEEFSVRYTVEEHWGQGESRVDRTYVSLEAFQLGKRYLDRRVTRRAGGGLPFAHERMCFDGDRTYSIHVRQAEQLPDVVLIMPGLDTRFIDVESPRSVVAAWLYETKRPLDELLTDAIWQKRAVEDGGMINGQYTVLVRLSTTQGEFVEQWTYWLAPERSFLPMRREIAMRPPGEAQLRTMELCDVVEMQPFPGGGWFPTHVLWTWPSVDQPRAELRVHEVTVGTGVFGKLRASLVTPPANVNDVSRNEMYMLVEERDRREAAPATDDAAAARIMIDLLEGVEPDIAAAAKARVTAVEAGRRHQPAGRRWIAMVGAGGVGAAALIGLGFHLWRRSRTVGGG